MERRRFLKNLVIGAVATTVPAKLLVDVLDTPANIPELWRIDYANKHIIYQGGDNQGITIGELYRFLQTEWEHEKGKFPFAMEENKLNVKGYKFLPV